MVHSPALLLPPDCGRPFFFSGSVFLFTYTKAKKKKDDQVCELVPKEALKLILGGP